MKRHRPKLRKRKKRWAINSVNVCMACVDVSAYLCISVCVRVCMCVCVCVSVCVCVI